MQNGDATSVAFTLTLKRRSIEMCTAGGQVLGQLDADGVGKVSGRVQGGGVRGVLQMAASPADSVHSLAHSPARSTAHSPARSTVRSGAKRKSGPGLVLLALPIVTMVLALSLVWGESPATSGAEPFSYSFSELLWGMWPYLAGLAVVVAVGLLAYTAPKQAWSACVVFATLLRNLLLFLLKHLRLALGHLAKSAAKFLLDETKKK